MNRSPVIKVRMLFEQVLLGVLSVCHRLIKN